MVTDDVRVCRRENPRSPGLVWLSHTRRWMNIPLLIDSIVRQTMVLIAQLSTTAGLRAPLAHVANQVFLDLVNELERQGVGRKVIADMFGLALRSYQQKVQRISESATDHGATLWEVVLRHIQERGIVARSEVLVRFARDDEASLRGILADLVGTGLVYKTGRAESTVYRAAAPEELGELFVKRDQDSEAAIVWVGVYRHGPIDRLGLLERFRIEPDALDSALDRLVNDGRVRRETRDNVSIYQAESCVIPLGHSAGWEAALLDHYQAVVGAVCAKVAHLSGTQRDAARIGGSTFSFDVWPGHPSADRVYALLQRTRAELCAIWDEVHAHNEHTGKPAEYDRVTFYFGQNVRNEALVEQGKDLEAREE